MGYSKCRGTWDKRHKSVRVCDGCDTCGKCDGVRMRHFHCYQCCGKLTACPKCAPKIEAHVKEANGEVDVQYKDPATVPFTGSNLSKHAATCPECEPETDQQCESVTEYFESLDTQADMGLQA